MGSYPFSRIRRLVPTRSAHVYLLLFVVSVLLRIPFLKTFNLVTYDGTYYISQAKALLGLLDRPLTFSLGYPGFIALFLPLIHDGVRAAQAVSFLAGMGSLFVFYSLAKKFVSTMHALLAALILALTPLFINLSMVTMSESLWLFFVLLGFFLFACNRDLAAGMALGMATITRVEALGVFAVMLIYRLRERRRLLKISAGFACLFCLNFAVLSFDRGELIVNLHLKSFNSSASSWKLREARIEDTVANGGDAQVSEGAESPTVVGHYLKRIPFEVNLLFWHIGPALLLLAIYGILFRKCFLLAAFLPFFVYPFFTTGSDHRFILPYIPALILYATIGLEKVPSRSMYRAFLVMIACFSAGAFWINRSQLVTPVSYGYEWAKEVGESFKSRVASSDLIADRKPYFAFYSGGQYLEIPLGAYNETLAYLAKRDVKYLVLESELIKVARPKLLPLLYDSLAINGEMRFSQVYFKPDVVSIYERNMDADPISIQYLLKSVEGRMSGLSWSPDGGSIAYRSMNSSGQRGIYAVSTETGQSVSITTGNIPEDQMSWSPDSKRIAFAMEKDGNTDIYAHDMGSHLERLVSLPGADRSPSYSKDGKELVFVSEQSGRSQVCVKNLQTGSLTRIAASGNGSYPSLSPDGEFIAWIRAGAGLFIYERKTAIEKQVAAPRKVHFTPAWSPDGRFIAVTALDRGKADIYLLSGDGSNALLLTKSFVPAAVPTWRPDGQALAALTIADKRMGILIISGLEPYAARLVNPISFSVVERQ